MGSKFDEWWNDHCKELFGVPSKGVPREKQKFPLNTKQPKTEAIRISLLVWMHRDTPADYVPRTSSYGGGTRYSKRGGNHLAIARKIIATEKRTATYLAPLDPDATYSVDGDVMLEDRIIDYVNDDKIISSLIGRYKRRGKKIVENVCQGMFP